MLKGGLPTQGVLGAPLCSERQREEEPAPREKLLRGNRKGMEPEPGLLRSGGGWGDLWKGATEETDEGKWSGPMSRMEDACRDTGGPVFLPARAFPAVETGKMRVVCDFIGRGHN